MQLQHRPWLVPGQGPGQGQALVQVPGLVQGDLEVSRQNMSRVKIVGGNWKCNGTRQSIQELVHTLNQADLPAEVQVLVFPPTIYLDYSNSLIRPDIKVGAQNCWTKAGAFTGEVSPAMIKDSGLEWVLVGHSERRHTVTHESEEELSTKVRASLDNGLRVTFCVGELLADREKGATRDVVYHQLEALKNAIKVPQEWADIVVAYEPVWAIGTGKVATPEIAQETHKWIRDWIAEHVGAEVANAIRIQYGGSVKGSNAAELARQPDIDGFLVGGASLTAEFVSIVQACKL